MLVSISVKLCFSWSMDSPFFTKVSESLSWVVGPLKLPERIFDLVGGWSFNPFEKYALVKMGENVWNHRSCRSHRVGAVTRRQSIVSLVLWALHGIANQWFETTTKWCCFLFLQSHFKWKKVKLDYWMFDPYFPSWIFLHLPWLALFFVNPKRGEKKIP